VSVARYGFGVPRGHKDILSAIGDGPMAVPGGKLAGIRLPVRTPRLALRLPQLSDVPRLVRYINDPLVFRPLMSRHAPWKRSEEDEFVRRSREAARLGSMLNLAITLRTTGELVGGIGLEVRDWDNGHAWTGYWLAPAYWHQGYGSEAASAVCRLAFRELRLHRIDASVFEFNPRSMRLLRGLGFRREGRKRQVLFRDGRWHDEVDFGLLAKEFRPAPRRRPGPTPARRLSGGRPASR
jgi:[ribosomal protein S5]-alanine N-acetyltransferase